MIKFIQEITDKEGGGKAYGLRILYDLGLNVPDAFVMIHPGIDTLDDAMILEHLEKLGHGPKAVRSSAASEDGSKASFAGQFETFLNLHTYTEIKNAIIKCIDAAGADRVKSYSGNLISGADLRISVILQNMIEPKIAGVVFSANPVNHRRDKMIINAISGQGDELVSGKRDPVHYEIFRSGSNILAEIQKNGNLLTHSQLTDIIDGTQKAERYLNSPADLEWAIDFSGNIHWLQVRPITTLYDEHYNELDTVRGRSDDVWTLGNIGEMMPGTATPLTYSVSAEAIDFGMTVLAEKGGAFRLKDRRGMRYIQMFYNRLFINMSHMMDYPKKIWLNKAEDIHFALSGRVIPGMSAVHEAFLPKRILNFIRQQYHTGRAYKNLEALRKLAGDFRVDTTGDPQQIHQALEEARHQLGIGFGHHLICSAQSGTLYSAIIRILTGNKELPAPEDFHKATILFTNIPGIESADAVKSLELFAKMIYGDPVFASRFVVSPPDEALRLLKEEAAPLIKKTFNDFLYRHGHRCIRESELREQTWEEDPMKLIHLLQVKVRMGGTRTEPQNTDHAISQVLRKIPPVKRMIIRTILPLARKAVARRETTKSFSIKMVSIIRKSYQVLAETLVRDKILEDTDQIYFLTHEEIGQLIRNKKKGLVMKANRRRNFLAEEEKLQFPDINIGIPEPIEQEDFILPDDSQLAGTPVSSGIIEGTVRIINSPEDAVLLEQGEIMVSSFTDIGWTPYFSIISGLITEIGSPLSHGAVVAREYGIPAIVGAKGAKIFLHTGDFIRMNGNNGIIEKISPKLI